MNSNDKANEQGHGHDKAIEIIVNGRSKTVTKKELSFDEIVALADNLPTGENVIYTVTYRRGNGNKPEGSITKGETVKIKDGEIFNVTATNKS